MVDESKITKKNKKSIPTQIGRFQIISELGRGGMGIVYKARDTKLDRIVALKVLIGNFITKEKCQRFFIEARSTAKLNHPNIIKIHDFGEEDQTCFIVMDYIKGRTLDTFLKNPLSPKQAAKLIYDICIAINYAHSQKITHRDLKPSNIMIQNNIVCIMDFGLAKIEDDDQSLTKSGAIMGSPAYMSPEQVNGIKKNIDFKTDIYSIGAIFYHCLTGQTCFDGSVGTMALLMKILRENPKPPRLIQSDIPPILENICMKALQKNKTKRYSSAIALAKDLERFLHSKRKLGHKRKRRHSSQKLIQKQLSKNYLFFTIFIFMLLVVFFLVSSTNDKTIQELDLNTSQKSQKKNNVGKKEYISQKSEKKDILREKKSNFDVGVFNSVDALKVLCSKKIDNALFYSSPLVIQNSLYINSNNAIYKLSLENLEIDWIYSKKQKKKVEKILEEKIKKNSTFLNKKNTLFYLDGGICSLDHYGNFIAFHQDEDSSCLSVKGNKIAYGCNTGNIKMIRYDRFRKNYKLINNQFVDNSTIQFLKLRSLFSFCASQNKIFSFQKNKNRKEIFSTKGKILASPIFRDNYIFAGDDLGYVYAFTKDLKIKFSYLHSRGGKVKSQVEAKNNYMYVFYNNGDFIIFNWLQDKIVGRGYVGQTRCTPSIIKNDFLCISNDDGVFHIFPIDQIIENGDKICQPKEINLEGGVVAKPIFHKEKIICVTDKGQVYLIGNPK